MFKIFLGKFIYYICRSLGQLSLLYGLAIRGMSSGARVFEVRLVLRLWSHLELPSFNLSCGLRMGNSNIYCLFYQTNDNLFAKEF